jgi:hypothetical protein
VPTANDEAWNRFFERTAILSKIESQGFAFVSADELKLHGEREPRLMAKLDTDSERPQLFKRHDLNILPARNGLYVIFSDPQNKLYFQFDSLLDDLPVEEFCSRIDLQSFDSFRFGTALSSESQVIDLAFLSCLLQHFCAGEAMHLTIRGRLHSGNFSFDLPCGQRLDVSNVQVEVDAGYENADSLVLIEAKIGRRTDFNIRQLVYPFRQWTQRSRKKIRPLFITYSNGEYLLSEFEIDSRFGEIRIVSNRAFVINDNPAAVIDLACLLRSVPVGIEPAGIPFPQADDMNKVVDLLKLLERGAAGKSAIAEFFEFEDRQSDYYANAASYLGFARRNKEAGGFELTKAGREFLCLPARTRRTRAILERLLQRPVFRDCIELLAQRRFNLNQVELPELQTIIAGRRGVIQASQTVPRRARTVRKWLSWLLKNVSFRECF